MDIRLDGRTALITGGSEGLGRATGRKLAESDYSVAILSSSGRGEELARELGGVGVTGSNQNPDDLKRLVETLTRCTGGTDVGRGGAKLHADRALWLPHCR